MAQDTRLCVKCGHEERFSDNEGGTCEVRIVLEQAELGVETTVCGCFCEFPFVACAQCESNARFNEAGGYREMAERCRAYCRRGHKEELAVASNRAVNNHDALVAEIKELRRMLAMVAPLAFKKEVIPHLPGNWEDEIKEWLKGRRTEDVLAAAQE